uniref:Uncharacterized protein LOC111109459 n=1 Tax=Crassostrea virginica TaxID=6565 RepID=A0A8B8BDK7_CRAVI|nr:uncharacterized protein LOC111109459 [Crassostrea virginica]
MEVLIFLLLFSPVLCSHFRGGSLSWAPTSKPSEIKISHQMAWRRSYSSSAYCDDAKISSQANITVSASTYCRAGCNSTSSVSSLYGRCIAFSASEDWTLTEGSFLFKAPTPGIAYTLRTEFCCWQSLRNGGSSSDIRLTMTADLRPRTDTGVINSSPVVTMTPIVRLLSGCSHQIQIPVIDADGDIVRCRFPTSSNSNECGYLCDGLPGSSLDSNTCLFSYNTTYGTGIYGVSVQIEDFATTAPSVVLSSVPLQFLVLVFTDSLGCNDAPTFVLPTPPEGSCHVVTSTFTKTLVARTKSAAHTVSKIFTMGLTGMTKSSLSPYGITGREWSIIVNWTPTKSQAGYHILCYSAEINSKLSSSMFCIDLLAGVAPEIKIAKGCVSPVGGIIVGSNITLTMCFDREFTRPTQDRYLFIHHWNGTVAYALNLKSPSVASFSSSADRKVKVTWNGTTGTNLLSPGDYYVLVQAGAVAAENLTCVRDWSGITQPYYWNFTVLDRTPPVLQLKSSPSEVKSNQVFSMTWTVNEPLLVENCTLTSPTSTSEVSCNGSFIQNNLPEGNYSITIEIKDKAGNKAEPISHQWVVTDGTPPTLTFTMNPSLTRSNASIAWTTSEPVRSSYCVVTFPDGKLENGTCSGRWEAVDLPRGSYQINVTLIDNAGLVGGPFLHTWSNVDVTPPILTFTHTPAKSFSSVNISWVTNEKTSGVCEVVGPSFYRSVVCDKTWSGDYLPEGDFTLNVTVYDESLNMAGPFQHNWHNTDVTPPSLSFTKNPSFSRSNASIAWTTNEPVMSSYCTVTYPDGNVKNETCSGQWGAVDLPRGSYQINITLVDRVGLSGGPFLHTWSNIDVTPPKLTFTQNPAKSFSSVNISWVTNEKTSGVCEVVGPSFYRSVVCDKTWSGDYLPEGDFTLNVTIYDESLNMAGPFQHKWHNKDVKPPVLSIRNTPLNAKSYDNASITWTYNEDATSTCVLQTSIRSAFVPCDKSWVGTFLPEGNVTLEIFAVDRYRNSAPSTSVMWFNEDTTPPVLTFTRTGTLTINDAIITWSVNEPASANCTLTTPYNTMVFDCNSGTWSGSNLLGGKYSLSILLLDLGNNSAGPFVHEWQNVDTIRPKVTLTETPTRTQSNATIAWTVSEPVNSSCEVRGASDFLRTALCDGRWTGLNLPSGSLVFSVLVTDTSGNIAGPFMHTWYNDDVTSPDLKWIGQPPSHSTGNLTLSWETDETVTSVCTVESPILVENVSCSNEWIGTHLANGEYLLTVRAVDKSGNEAHIIHHWNNTIQELTFEIVLTLTNVNVTDVPDKSSPKYTALESDGQTALENFYRPKINNLKAVLVRYVTVSTSARRKRNANSSGKQLVIDHTVLLEGTDRSAGTASLSKSLSSLSKGESSIALKGTPATFSEVTLIVNRALNVTFRRQTSACDIAQLYVTCSFRDICDEATATCVKRGRRAGNSDLILVISLGVTAAVILILALVILFLFYLRNKTLHTKERRIIKRKKRMRSYPAPRRENKLPVKYWPSYTGSMPRHERHSTENLHKFGNPSRFSGHTTRY